jgi:hypothetical protein
MPSSPASNRDSLGNLFLWYITLVEVKTSPGDGRRGVASAKGGRFGGIIVNQAPASARRPGGLLF